MPRIRWSVCHAVLCDQGARFTLRDIVRAPGLLSVPHDVIFPGAVLIVWLPVPVLRHVSAACLCSADYVADEAAAAILTHANAASQLGHSTRVSGCVIVGDGGGCLTLYMVHRSVPQSALFVLNVIVSFQGMARVNIPLFLCLRRTTLAFVMLGEIVVLGSTFKRSTK